MTATPIDIDDETLMALADGELPPDRARWLEAQVAANPALAARLALFTDTRQIVQAAMDPGPVPDRLIAAIERGPMAEVVPLRPRSRPGWQSMALAASVAALAVGAFVLGRIGAPDPQAPAQVAALALADQLTGQTATLPGGTGARVLASYDTSAGLCRLIQLTPPAGLAQRAVVCRSGAGWDVALSVAVEGGGFLPASDAATEIIDGFLDTLSAAEPLTPDQESAALRP